MINYLEEQGHGEMKYSVLATKFVSKVLGGLIAVRRLHMFITHSVIISTPFILSSLLPTSLYPVFALGK